MGAPRSFDRSRDDSEAESLWDRAREAGVNPLGACLVALGAALILAAFTIFNWFRSDTGFFGGAGTHTTFSQVHDTIEHYKALAAAQGLSTHVSFATSGPYFSWLGWLLFVLALGTGALAVSRLGGRHWSLRWLASVVAATGVGFTFLALNLVVFEGNAPNNANAPSYGDFLAHSGLGAWAAIAGFVLMIVGALVPRRGL